MKYIALWVGKCSLFGLRLFRRRGAALPGLLAERLCPDFLANTLNQLPQGIVVISGTNGKTTTTKLVTAMLAQKYRVLTNPTGSNFTRGVVSSVIQQSNWRGKLPFDIAVIELDEAYAVHFVEIVKPRGVVLLNVMRDQMDRFAEIDHTARLLRTVALTAQEFIIYNAEDPRIVQAVQGASAEMVKFGTDNKLRSIFINDDELHSSSSTKSQNLKSAFDFELMDCTDSSVKIRVNGQIVSGRLTLEGAHNALNAVAALAVVGTLGVDIKTSFKILQNIRPAFGRGEHIFVDDKKIVLQLVKNPGGFRHVLRDIQYYDAAKVMIAINDDYADGRDVSWLWDVSFELLKDHRITASGTRAYDMALRLQYDECIVGHIEPKLQEAINTALAEAKPKDVIVVYATYTAMLELRKYLSTLTEVEMV